ncbi:L-threonate dehydrogenase [Rhizobium sp. 21-4511-3d]|jgi:3-hydroxyisobutyrate dehydrogenase
MDKKTIDKLAVIGLGSMGMGVALSLLQNGFTVSGYDVNPSATAQFVSHGGKGATSPAKAARDADALITVVVNAAQTQAVLFGDGGAAETLPKGSVILSLATMPPQAAKEIALKVQDAGYHFIDAPMSGGSVRAAQGELTLMASGPSAAFDRCETALNAIAQKVYRLGEEPGIGSSFKIVNQLLAGVHIAAACEAVAFAKALGLDIAKVYDVITASAGNSWMFENRVPHIIAGDYTPHSSVNIFTKDLGIVSDLGRSLNFPLPVASTALQMFIMTAASGMGHDDDSSVARLLANIAGLELPSAAKD